MTAKLVKMLATENERYRTNSAHGGC